MNKLRSIYLLTNLCFVLLLTACTIVVAQPSGPESLDTFSARVEEAIRQGDYDAMPALMGNTFTLAYWRSESVSVSPASAVEQLRRDLSSSAPIQFRNDIELSALLDGADPLMMAGPEVKLVRALFSSGWGSGGTGETIQLIAQDADGKYYWYGTLFAFNGFDDRPTNNVPTPKPTSLPTPKPTSLPVNFDVRSTSVKYVMAQTNVNIRSGPGTAYPIIGGVAEGQIALVTGILADGSWWRVICPNDTVGNCFVSADPALVQPTTAPGGPNSPPTPPPADGPGEAYIDTIEVNILESYPVQAQAIVRGHLPDACTYIEHVAVARESTSFRIRLATARQPNQRCAQVLTPFEEIVPLEVIGLPAGQYDVRLNNAVATFTLQVDN